MGLDMYFTGKRYLWNFGDNGDTEIAKAIGQQFPEIRDKRVKQVEVEFMYWRKDNQIHKWFVDNVQEGVDECQETFVPVEKLHELRDVCRAVMASPEQAATLLPAQSGFFFGGTEYDEWYFDGVKRTAEWLDELLEDMERLKSWDFYYQSSW
jgi:hypothetical protein